MRVTKTSTVVTFALVLAAGSAHAEEAGASAPPDPKPSTAKTSNRQKPAAARVDVAVGAALARCDDAGPIAPAQPSAIFSAAMTVFASGVILGAAAGNGLSDIRVVRLTPASAGTGWDFATVTPAPRPAPLPVAAAAKTTPSEVNETPEASEKRLEALRAKRRSGTRGLAASAIAAK